MLIAEIIAVARPCKAYSSHKSRAVNVLILRRAIPSSVLFTKQKRSSVGKENPLVAGPRTLSQCLLNSVRGKVLSCYCSSKGL